MIRAFLTYIRQMSMDEFWSIHQPNCSVNCILVQDGTFHVEKENILYYDEMETMEHPGGQAETEDNAYLQKVDVNALNPAILQKFLSNGLQEETENFVKDYFMQSV